MCTGLQVSNTDSNVTSVTSAIPCTGLLVSNVTTLASLPINQSINQLPSLYASGTGMPAPPLPPTSSYRSSKLESEHLAPGCQRPPATYFQLPQQQTRVGASGTGMPAPPAIQMQQSQQLALSGEPGTWMPAPPAAHFQQPLQPALIGASGTGLSVPSAAHSQQPQQKRPDNTSSIKGPEGVRCSPGAAADSPLIRARLGLLCCCSCCVGKVVLPVHERSYKDLSSIFSMLFSSSNTFSSSHYLLSSRNNRSTKSCG
ncbi:cadherin-related family member 5-like [Thunnus maccoyii]|uniref:cadherin-related family member 5-like n=1 Tax=Thunnus maccoyii TaxID=8240 RepID=UPI001C4ACFB8|nr:cadherin-related family member 5-like [Thunnus maccoyii]